MNRFSVLLFPAGLLVLSLSCSLFQPMPKQKGFNFASWWPGQYSSTQARESLAILKSTGADWIAVLVTAYQPKVDSASIVYSATPTPTDDDLRSVFKFAKDLGLSVMLKPHLDLSNDREHWRGDIGKGFKTPEEWEGWFDSYTGMMAHYAQIAEASRIPQLCIGVELDGTIGREGNWRKVAEAVRQRFTGRLVYATNHLTDASVTWWDAVDLIGIDAYYPLAKPGEAPSLPELKAFWNRKGEELERLSEHWNKPVILTEVGYRSQAGALEHPWDYSVENAVDLGVQELGYRALFESLFEKDWLAGTFLWDWRTDPDQGGPLDPGYTPHGKPALEVVKKWYAPEGRESSLSVK